MLLSVAFLTHRKLYKPTPDYLNMAKARIKLFSTDIKKVDKICDRIIGIAKKLKIKSAGPIPLPTKKLLVPIRKSPDGEGKASWDRWEMRIHKRMLDVDSDERALHQIMKTSIPKDVNIEIQIID